MRAATRWWRINPMRGRDFDRPARELVVRLPFLAARAGARRCQPYNSLSTRANSQPRSINFLAWPPLANAQAQLRASQ